MASTSDIAHRWANQQFGKRDGSLNSKSTSCDETSFYSYSTVIAQWLDKERKIMAIIDQGLTKTTLRHVYDVQRAVTHDTTVFRFHCPGSGYSGYANVNVCDWQGKVRSMYVTKNYINLLYDEILSVNKCRSLDPGSLHWWNELQRWENFFPEASVKKFLRIKLIGSDIEIAIQKSKRKMVRALLAGATFEEVVDVVNGEGAWQAYLERTKGTRTTANKRAYADKIAQHLGLHSVRACDMSVKQLLALTPAERVQLKLWQILKPTRTELSERKRRSINNLLKFIGIVGEYRTYGYFDFCDEPKVVIDPSTNQEIYRGSHRSDWRLPTLRFGDKDLETAKQNPVKFRQWFLNKAKALGKLHRGSHLTSSEVLAGYDLECYNAYREFVDKYNTRENTRMKRYEEERRRAEEERRAKEAERARLIDSYKARGIDGYRDLWRERYDLRPNAYTFNADEFYYGGNVLLRYNPSSEQVETSKDIRLTVPQAKKLWRVVVIWHNNPEKFKRIEIATKNSTFTAHSYDNDILVAGCHSVAYSEMERMAKQLNFI